jgi:hypothetical protein
MLLILPDGFQGVVWMVAEQPDGIVPAVADGVEKFNIPDTGVLKVRSDPFRRPRRLLAQHRNGRPLQVLDQPRPAEADPNQILALHSFGPDKRIVFFVGPYTEYRRFETDRWALREIAPGPWRASSQPGLDTRPRTIAE